jgi:hypothetical protein
VAAKGSIVVLNPQPWFGNQKLGGFTVYIDGRRVGTVLPESSAEFPCSEGSHTVRVRRRFYFSDRVEVAVTPGSVSLTAGIKGEGVAGGMASLMFTPWKALSLSP